MNPGDGTGRSDGSAVPAMKHHGWKKTGVICGIIAVVMVLFLVAVPKLFDLNRYHDIIESRIEEALGGEVRLGRISWGLSRGIWLQIDGVFIRDARMFPGEADFSRVYARVQILPLLKKRIVLKRLRMEGSEVDLRIEELPPTTSTNHEAIALEIEHLDLTIDRLAVDDRLTVFGRVGTRVFWNIDISAAPIVPGREIDFELSLGRSERPNFEGLSARGTFSGLTEAWSVESPELKLNALIDSLDVDVFERYFPDRQSAERLDGKISIEMQYEGDLVERYSIGGMIDMGRVSYRNPDLFENVLTGEGATLTYRMKLDSDDLTVEKVELRAGGFSLDVTARVHFPGDEDMVINSAEISSSTRLVDLMPYIPWPLLGDSSDAVRKMCMAGGTIDMKNVLLSEVRLSEAPKDPKDLLARFRLTANFSDVSLPKLFFLPGVDKVSGRMTFEKGVFLAEDIQALIGPMSLPIITVRATRIARQPKVSFRAEGPLRVVATGGESKNEVLERYGLKEFHGLAEVELSADYDQSNPEKWVAEGLVSLKGVHLEAYPLDAVMDDLRGEIELSRKELFNVKVRDLSATINRTLFRMSGNLTGIGTSEMSVAGEVFSENLNLAGLSKLLPALKDYDPGGHLDLDLDVHIPYASIAESRVSGMLKGRDVAFRLPERDLAVDRGNADITLTGDAANIDTMTLRINGKPVALSGDVTGIGTPEMSIAGEVFSEDLDLAGLPKLVPILKDFDPGGSLDLDLDVHILYPSLAESQVSGTLKGRDVSFRVPEYDLAVDEGKADITLAGNAAYVESMNLLMNGQPLAFSGNLTGVGTPEMLVDGEVFSEKLDMARLSRLVPVLEEYDPSGRLDMDLDVHIQYPSLAESRVYGTLNARDAGFRLSEYGLTAEGGSADIMLKENAAEIDSMALQINGQLVILSGEVSDPGEPKMKLFLRSPGFDLDRILMDETSSDMVELPPWAENLTADISATSGVVQYSGTPFQNVYLGFLYDHGVMKNYHLNFDIDGGTTDAKGAADFRNPGRIPFVLNSDSEQLPAAKLALLLGRDQFPIKGPLSIKTRLTGHTGTIDEVFAGLDGDLDVKSGKGEFKGLGALETILTKLSALTSIEGFFKGRTFDNLMAEGLPFRSMEAETSFSDGTLNVEKLFIKADAMNIDSKGTLDLVNRQMAMEAQLIPLSVADSTFDLVPIVGDTAQSITRIHLKVTGPMDDPDVRVEQVRSVLKDLIKKPGEILKDIGEGLKKIVPGNKEEENQ